MKKKKEYFLFSKIFRTIVQVYRIKKGLYNEI